MKTREVATCEGIGPETTIVFGIGNRSADDVVNLVTTVLSGFTLTFGWGGWKDANGQQHLGRSAIVRANGLGFQDATDATLQLATVFEQETMHVVVGGHAGIVTTKVVDRVDKSDG